MYAILRIDIHSYDYKLFKYFKSIRVDYKLYQYSGTNISS